MYIYIINQFYNCQSKEYTNYSMYTKVAIVAEAILYKLWTRIRKARYWKGKWWKNCNERRENMSDYKFSISLSQIAELASLGIRQSPLGLIEILPTLGPSGRQERLNC